MPLNLLLTPSYEVADSATKSLLFLMNQNISLFLRKFYFNSKHKWKVSMILRKKRSDISIRLFLVVHICMVPI